MSRTVECTRRLEFAAGHRVMGHESKCAHLHGHNYIVFVTAQIEGAEPTDSIGRVIDFSEIKRRLGGWIEEFWDHGFLYHIDDSRTARAIEAFDAAGSIDHHVSHSKTYALRYNPTAENLAKYLLEEVCPKVFSGTGITVTKVRVWETPNCYAEATLV